MLQKTPHLSSGFIGRCCILLGCSIFLIFLYRFHQIDKTELISSENKTFEKAVITEIIEDNLQESGVRTGYQVVKMKLLSGSFKGTETIGTSASGYLYGADCEVGMTVTAVINESNGEITASVFSYYRSPALLGLVLVFLLSIWIIGGKKGLASVFGLIFTFLCIIYLFLPMIYKGISPCLSAVLIAVLITVVTIYMIAGISVKSFCAISGTVAGIVISGMIAFLAGKLSHISGYNVSDIENLIYIGERTNMQIGELMFAGIIISSLGAVMDVAMSVSSAVNEISINSPERDMKQLFRSGINVGRDMMGTMSNTLILAFTGGSLNTLIYIYCYDYPARRIFNMNDIAIEMIQGIASSMGVVLTVPLVSLLSAWLLSRNSRKRMDA